MSSVKKYQIFCVDEGKWSPGFSADPPVKCYNNTSHEVNPDSVQELEMEAGATTRILDEFIPTGGNKIVKSFTHSFPSGDSYYDIQFPTPVNLFKVKAHLTGIGNTFHILVNPNYSLGTGSITEDVKTGDTVLHVNPDKMDKLFIGLEIAISDGTQVNFMSTIIIKDTVTNTVTTDAPAANDWSKDSSVNKTNMYCVREYKVLQDTVHSFQMKSGGHYVPTGDVIRFAYNNIGQNAESVTLFLEYAF